MPENSTLVAFTDGLVERRGELLDVGFERLARAAQAGAGDLDEFVASLVSGVTGPDSADDIALLVFRWTDGAATVRSDAPVGRAPGATMSEAPSS
jgi:hypothetical protein